MPKFAFRLERLLKRRAALESEAKETFLMARARRIAEEAKKDALPARRAALLQQPIFDLADRLNLQAALQRVDDHERLLDLTIADLQSEEDSLQAAWLQARRDLQVLEKLRERAYHEFEREVARSEQRALDEWAVLRRA